MEAGQEAGGLRDADRRPLARVGVLLPAREVHCAGQRGRPEHPGAIQRRSLPRVLQGIADLLSWDAYRHTTLDTSNPPFWRWFVGGRLNACYNCVDRHLATSRNKAAFIWVPESETEDTKVITYHELHRRVNEFAALLRDYCHLKVGGRVTFHLPMVPELPFSMLACARLGGHSLGGVRRIQWSGVRRPDRRLGKPHPSDDGRLLPQRRAARPQGQSRRGGGHGPRPRCPGRQGPGVAPTPRPVRVEQSHDRRAGLLRKSSKRNPATSPARPSRDNTTSRA